MVGTQKAWQLQCSMLSALRSGDTSLLRSLLDSGLDCDITFRLSGCSRPAVCLAVERGHVGLVELLCARRCSTSALDSGGLTPLHLAASLGYADIANTLIKNRAEINSSSSLGGDTPLHLAASGNHHQVVQLLLEQGAAVNLPNVDGKTSLMYAAAKGYQDIAQLLLSHGANPNTLDNAGNSALLLHCSSAWVTAEMVVMLSPSLAVINRSNTKGNYPILEIVKSYTDQKHRALVAIAKQGADLNVTSTLGATPLHIACSIKDWCSAQILVRAGAELDHEDHLGHVPLLLTLTHNTFLLAGLMVAAGANCLFRADHNNRLSKEARAWVRSQQKKTKSLKDISRLVVRKMMARRLDRCIEKAEMPNSLKQYVYFLLE